MKKTLLYVGALIGMMALAACGNGPSEEEDASSIRVETQTVKADEAWMKEKAQKQYESLQELVGDELYLNMMLNSSDMLEEIGELKGLKLDLTKPVQTYQVDLKFVKDILDDEKIDYDDLSAAAKELLEFQVKTIVPTQINASKGVKYVAIASAVTTGKTYAVDEASEDQTWLIATERDDVYVTVTFTYNEEFSLENVSCGFLFCTSELKEAFNRFPGIKLEQMDW